MFLEGDKPNDKCYVVISGRVGIYRNKVGCDIKIGNLHRNSFMKDAGGEEKAYPSFEDPIYQGESLKLMKRLSFYGDMLAKLNFGRLFGDTALMNDNLRNASILTLEETEFMVFHKSALDVIKKYYSKDFNQKLEFLIKLIPEMALITNKSRITQISEFFKPAKYLNGAFIIKEEEVRNKIFLMERGEVVVFKEIDVPSVEDNRKPKYVPTQTAICMVNTPSALGEECLEGDGRYQYSVQIKSAEASFYVFEKSSNLAEFQSFPLFAIFLRGYHQKETLRKSIITNLQIQRMEKIIRDRHMRSQSMLSPAGTLLRKEISAANPKPTPIRIERFSEEENQKHSKILKRLTVDVPFLNTQAIDKLFVPAVPQSDEPLNKPSLLPLLKSSERSSGRISRTKSTGVVSQIGSPLIKNSELSEFNSQRISTPILMKSLSPTHKLQTGESPGRQSHFKIDLAEGDLTSTNARNKQLPPPKKAPALKKDFSYFLLQKIQRQAQEYIPPISQITKSVGPNPDETSSQSPSVLKTEVFSYESKSNIARKQRVLETEKLRTTERDLQGKPKGSSFEPGQHRSLMLLPVQDIDAPNAKPQSGILHAFRKPSKFCEPKTRDQVESPSPKSPNRVKFATQAAEHSDFQLFKRTSRRNFLSSQDDLGGVKFKIKDDKVWYKIKDATPTAKH